MYADVKITVLKQLFLEDVVEEYAEGDWAPCDRLSEGQEFVVGGRDLAMGFSYCNSTNFRRGSMQ